MGGWRDGRARGGGRQGGVRRLGLVAVLAVAAAAGVTVWTVTAEPEWYQRVRYPLRYEEIVRGHARNYDLPPTLLAAVIYTESKFDADARSRAGAVGLMQLLPETAKGIAVRTGGGRFVVSDLLDPEVNVRYGSWYLRNLLNRYDDVRTALAAYHAGQGNVDEWRREGVGIEFPETRSYVDKVLDVQRVYADAYAEELR
jgi:soluble lytic murein transglycosylase